MASTYLSSSKYSQTHNDIDERADQLQSSQPPRLAEAANLYRQNLRLSQYNQGKEHEDALYDMERLSFCLQELKNYEEAVELDQEVLRIRYQKGQQEDKCTIETQHDLARNLHELGKYDEAKRLNRQNLRWREKNLGDSNDDTLASRQQLITNLFKLGEHEEAAWLGERTLSIRRSNHSNSADLIPSRHNLAATLLALHRTKEATKLHEENLQVRNTARNDYDQKVGFEENLPEQFEKVEFLDRQIQATRKAERERLALVAKRQEAKGSRREPATWTADTEQAKGTKRSAPLRTIEAENQGGYKPEKRSQHLRGRQPGSSDTDPLPRQNNLDSHDGRRTLSMQDNVRRRRSSEQLVRQNDYRAGPNEELPRRAVSMRRSEQQGSQDIIPQQDRTGESRQSTPTNFGRNSQDTPSMSDKRLNLGQQKLERGRPVRQESENFQPKEWQQIKTAPDRVQDPKEADTTPRRKLTPSAKKLVSENYDSSTAAVRSQSPIPRKKQSTSQDVNRPVQEGVAAEPTQRPSPKWPVPIEDRQGLARDTGGSQVPSEGGTSVSKVQHPCDKCAEIRAPQRVKPTRPIPNEDQKDFVQDIGKSCMSREGKPVTEGIQHRRETGTVRGKTQNPRIGRELLDDDKRNAARNVEPKSPSAQHDISEATPIPSILISPPPVTHQPHLLSNFSDATNSADDIQSAKQANQWFRDLREETQTLLEPLRKDNVRRVRIAIIDTGIDTTHPEMRRRSDRLQRRADFLSQKIEHCEIDTCGHGTHAAALILRVAPGADLYVARVVEDNNAVLDPEIVASAITHATTKWKVDIITLSLGFRGTQETVRRAIDAAASQDILIFAAASNDGTRHGIAFPANCASVIGVNAARGTGAASDFNPAPLPDSSNFSILGESVSSAWPSALGGGQMERCMSGTSIATPIAAAVAALVLEFVRQKPALDMISHVAELKRAEGMKEIFKEMGTLKDGYLNIVPWKLLKSHDSEHDRLSVAYAIARRLKDRFG